MQHLFISREYPPSPYSTGGIGTYVEHTTRLLAARGETVHVIAQQWPGAPRSRESHQGGRLLVHRVPLDQAPDIAPPEERAAHHSVLQALRGSRVPAQAFMWNAALMAEWLIEHEAIDVIEAQEYEAPSYVLMARRASGLGPSRRVPIVVHLHTPTEFILRANGWDEALAEQAPLIDAETYVIHAADALLCPSHFLARIAESHYQLPAGRVQTLPYPVGDTAILPRDARTWSEGAVGYVGRMEPRKGVSEWLDAALSTSDTHPDARFTYIGGDTWWPGHGERSVRETLIERVPAAQKARVSFLDAVPRRDLATQLERTRIAVVPSRWENFPFTCIEAMASGLPVLVAPTGGMVEMVEDGRTGWIAESAEAASLAAALRRALALSPGELASMGLAAAASIRGLCGEAEICRRSLDFRREVVAMGIRAQVDRPLPLQLPELSTAAVGSGARTELTGDTMTLRQILDAPGAQQRAVLRRALADPTYVVRWASWHWRRRSQT